MSIPLYIHIDFGCFILYTLEYVEVVRMVNLHVQEIARERGITTITELAEKANLAYDTARDLWHGRMQRIDRDVLARVCVALDVKPGDLLILEERPINKNRPVLAVAF